MDILIGNEVEICSLTAPTSSSRVELVRGPTRLAALTRSAQRSVLVAGAGPSGSRRRRSRGDRQHRRRRPLCRGLLYGLTHDLPLAACGRLASLAAAAVLGQLGARPEQPLAPLVGQAQAT